MWSSIALPLESLNFITENDGVISYQFEIISYTDLFLIAEMFHQLTAIDK
jgi:hypothetical protein